MDQFTPSILIVSLLIGARLLPFAVMLPRVFSPTAPRRWGLAVALLLSLSLSLLLSQGAEDERFLGLWVGDVWPLALAVMRELLLGLALACGFSVLLGSMFLVGNLLGQMSGANMPDVTDPQHGAMGDTALQRYFTWLALMVFLVSGGHRQMVESLIDSFRVVPLGSPLPSLDVPELAGQLLAQSFMAGLRVAAPVAFCLIVSTVVVAVLARGMPSLGAFGMGVGVNLIVLLLATCLSIEAMATSYQRSWAAGMDQVLDAWLEGEDHPPHE
jgi:flagellar biosynthesis protein FliR